MGDTTSSASPLGSPQTSLGQVVTSQVLASVLMSSMVNRQSYRVCTDGLGSQGDGTRVSLLPTLTGSWGGVRSGHLLNVLLENWLRIQ